MSTETKELESPKTTTLESTKLTKLDSNAFALACGLLWSGAVVVLGITARFGWGERWQALLADVYKGYHETVAGLVIGALWAFIDAFTGGYLFAKLYNVLRK